MWHCKNVNHKMRKQTWKPNRNENNDGQKNKKAQNCNGCRIVCHNDRDKVKRFFFSKKNNPYESLPITLPELPWREKVLSHINTVVPKELQE